MIRTRELLCKYKCIMHCIVKKMNEKVMLNKISIKAFVSKFTEVKLARLLMSH